MIDPRQWHEIDPRGIERASRPVTDDSNEPDSDKDEVEAWYKIARQKASQAFDTTAASLDLAHSEYLRRCRDAHQAFRIHLRHMDRTEADATLAGALAGARLQFNSDLIEIAETHRATFGRSPVAGAPCYQPQPKPLKGNP